MNGGSQVLWYVVRLSIWRFLLEICHYSANESRYPNAISIVLGKCPTELLKNPTMNWAAPCSAVHFHLPRLARVVTFLLAIASTPCGIAQTVAPAAPPPPTLRERVMQAELIVVGRATNYIYRGISPSSMPEEYDKDFPTNNDKGNRALEAIVRISEVLYSKKSFEMTEIRVSRPLPHDKSDTLEDSKILILRELRILDRGGGREIEAVYLPIGSSLDVSNRRSILEILVVEKNAK